MIYIANDIGSKEFAPDIRKRIHVPVEVTEMSSGDFGFKGNGPLGKVYVGIERKAIGDMLASMRQGRYAGFQMPNMGKDFDVAYLLVEGLWRPNSDGLLEVPIRVKGKTIWVPYRLSLAAKLRRPTPPYMYSELDKHLCTVEIQKNVALIRSTSKMETVWQIINRYQWWQKAWDEHHSADPIKVQAETTFTEITWCRKFANMLPGVGWKTSMAVAKHFGTIENAVNALSSEWRDIPGIGEKMAVRLYGTIRSTK